ncbi:DUF4352 domain-containing protein [Streptomyces yaizuensis]|uniref:DUF4352 domain-containing protein n=1 Tax=Streptomyces yaizuensis TaxID=2989713 RepID=A0ABQ5NXC2_9ACTN|nr:DUF4352 domain-containing protein [Streptomyces sp. YSPA8]GLF94869.1 DUF4352 domain-containing protein [Streptomyces sp. YSPA8]
MRTTKTAIAGSLLALTALTALTACGSDSSGDEAKPAPTVTVTKTVTASPSTPTEAEPVGALRMGAQREIAEPENGIRFTVQALSYQQPYKGPQPEAPADFQGGDTWATADVKICDIAGKFSVSQFPWSLVYSDGTSIEITGSTGGDMPKPEFPMDRSLKPGQCARGLVAFPVPGDKRPEHLVYAPEQGESVDWRIPKG